jgi:hypothetical protein
MAEVHAGGCGIPCATTFPEFLAEIEARVTLLARCCQWLRPLHATLQPIMTNIGLDQYAQDDYI